MPGGYWPYHWGYCPAGHACAGCVPLAGGAGVDGVEGTGVAGAVVATRGGAGCDGSVDVRWRFASRSCAHSSSPVKSIGWATVDIALQPISIPSLTSPRDSQLDEIKLYADLLRVQRESDLQSRHLQMSMAIDKAEQSWRKSTSKFHQPSHVNLAAEGPRPPRPDLHFYLQSNSRGHDSSCPCDREIQ